MNYFGLGRYFHNVREFYKEINAATLTGAIDVVIVRQPDGTYLSSPFHVRFGKLGVLRAREKIVDITINGEEKELHMKLGENGEGFFVLEADDDEELPENLATSPIDTSGGEMMERILGDGNGGGGNNFSADRSLTFDRQARIEEGDDGEDNYTNVGSRMADELVHHFEGEFPEPGGRNSAEQPQPVSNDEDRAVPKKNLSNSSGSSGEEKKQQVNNNRRRRRRKKATSKPPGKLEKPDDEIFEMEDVHTDGEQEQTAEEAVTPCPGEKNGAENDEAVVPQSLPESRRLSEIHPFSDTDLSPVASPHVSRAETPIKSDTEYELSEHRTELSRGGHGGDNSTAMNGAVAGPPGSQLHWNWGELPARQTPSSSSAFAYSETLAAAGTAAMDAKPLGDGKSSWEVAAVTTEVSPTAVPTESASPVGDETSITVELEEEAEPATSVLGSMFSFMRRSRNPATRVRGKAPLPERRTLSVSDSPPGLMTPLTTTMPGVCATVIDGSFSDVSPGQVTDEDRVAAQVLEPAPPSVTAEMTPPSAPAAVLPLTSIYLDDLTDDIEPEIAALYLRTGRPSRIENPGSTVPHLPALPGIPAREEDLDSGKGPSLSHSPNSNLGDDFAIASDSDDCAGTALDEVKMDHCPSDLSFKSRFKELAMSKCGSLSADGGPKPEEFEEKRVTFDQLCEDTSLFSSPDLVVRLNGRYMSIQTASRVVWSELLFKRPLPEEVLERHLTREAEASKKSSSWFYWRRSTSTASSAPAAAAAGAATVPEKTPPAAKRDYGPETSGARHTADALKVVSEPDLGPSPTSGEEEEEEEEEVLVTAGLMENEDIADDGVDGDDVDEDDASSRRPTVKAARIAHLGTVAGRSMSEPSVVGAKPFRRTLSNVSRTRSNATSDSVSAHRKSLRLTSEQVEALNLRDGVNDCVFSVTTAFQGTSKCGCYIFLWNWTDKIVISDIDGTITRSDVLGHIMPMIGNSWAQAGVSQLFTKIARNNYKFLYLSARAIGQARITREYLRSVRQDDHELPLGPLMLNPSSLLSAFHREVIIKKPEEFKIACMKDVLALFPPGVNPFYAGYGNRINDVWAYRAVGVPVSRIFTINHRGEVRHELTQTFQTSYCGLAYMVDMVFPPRPEPSPDGRSSRGSGTIGVPGGGGGGHSGPVSMEEAAHQAADQEMYSDFLYWRDPLPEPVELSDAVQKSDAPLSRGLDLVVAAGPDADLLQDKEREGDNPVLVEDAQGRGDMKD